MKAVWTPDCDKKLERLWRTGWSDSQIADELDRSYRAVYCRRVLLNLTKLMEDARAFASPSFPKFENITKAEARLVRANAPDSARIIHQDRQSLVGNCSAMCADKGMTIL